MKTRPKGYRMVEAKVVKVGCWCIHPLELFPFRWLFIMRPSSSSLHTFFRYSTFNVSCLLFARVAFNFLANWFSPFQPLVLHSILALSSRFPSQPILFCVFPSLPCLFALIKGYTFHFLRNFRNFLYFTKSFGMIFLNVLFSPFVSKTRFSKHKWHISISSFMPKK